MMCYAVGNVVILGIPLMNKPDNFARLGWACRRGMKELDLLLIPFLENCLSDLPESQQQIFTEMLESTDPELFAWLLGHEQPQQTDYLPLIKMIREYATTKTNAR